MPAERGPSGTGHDTAAMDRCKGVASRGIHEWVRTYQGATLDSYKCVNLGCGVYKTTEGTLIRAR